MALTFDAEHPDRPAPAGATERVLEALARRGIRATFFLQGRWAQAYPGIAASIAAGGHLIGNHSFYHVPMPMLSAAGFRADVRDAEHAIIDATGVDPRPWFRCPFGAGSDDVSVRSRLEGMGYHETPWHVDPEDWDPRTTPAAFVRRVVTGVQAHGSGAVVLAHPWTTAADRGIDRLLDALAGSGAVFVRLDEPS